MSPFWKRDRLERELRARRPEPRRELVRAIEDRIRASGSRRRLPSVRAGLAVGLSAAMLVAFGAFGGMGYAAGAAKQVTKVAQVAHAVQSIASASSRRDDDRASPARGNGRRDDDRGNDERGRQGAGSRGHSGRRGGGEGGNHGGGNHGGGDHGGGHDDDHNPADDQYKPGKGCGDRNHVHLRENECRKPPR